MLGLYPNVSKALSTSPANNAPDPVPGDRYWVAAAAGRWDNYDNWSETSGGAGGASVPREYNDVYFDENGLGECNVNIDFTVNSITATAGAVSINAEMVTIGNFLFDGASLSGVSMNGCIINIGGDFSLQGRSGDWIVFDATAPWYLTVSGTITPVKYVDTEYSDASGGNLILIDQTDWDLNIDRGNNINWGFPADETDGDITIDLNNSDDKEITLNVGVKAVETNLA
jgi:hypothetical protein